MDTFLAHLGLQHLKPIFESEEVHLEDFPGLSEAQMKSMGIKMGPISRIKNEIGPFLAAQSRQSVPSKMESRASSSSPLGRFVLSACSPSTSNC
jgi:hypothetical protein